MSYLDDLRKRIDEIDRKLGELFAERMDVVEEIAKYKEQHGLPILDTEREKEVIRKNLSRLKNKDRTKEAEEFFARLMEISRKYQAEKIFAREPAGENPTLSDKTDDAPRKLRVCFQGTAGSFSEQALWEYFGGEVEKISVTEFEDVFKELENKRADCGILPLENSSTGGVAEVYDLLRQYGFFIIGEKSIDVQQNLLGLKGAVLSELREVHSHPQALGQSSSFFKNHPHLKLIPYYNTAASAEYIKNLGDIRKAAVASKRAAEIFDLEIMAENINYSKNNKTRFIIIGREMNMNSRNNKISVVFALEHRVGSLYNALKYFAENNLNLLKIESRPILDQPWQYFFYIDFEGNLEDRRVRESMRLMEKNCFYFKLLGNYESDS